MYIFSDLKDWFDIIYYSDINDCRKIEINMKDINSIDIDRFCLEFSKYIVHLRCPIDEYTNKMLNSIDGKYTLTDGEKQFFINLFYTGFISDSKFTTTNDYKKSFDNDSIKGYFGECLYYIIREQILEDEKKYIEPQVPKQSSKVSGIDFIDIRKDSNGYYMIIGEVKTTSGHYTTRWGEILDSFVNRTDKTFSEMYQFIKSCDDGNDPEYTVFLRDILDIFYSLKLTPSLQKRYAGVINYGFEGQPIGSNAFRSFKSKLVNKVYDNSICRRIKLVGVYNIDNIIELVRDNIWNNL